MLDIGWGAGMVRKVTATLVQRHAYANFDVEDVGNAIEEVTKDCRAADMFR